MAQKAQQASLAIDFGRIRLAHDSRTKQLGDFRTNDQISTDHRIIYTDLQDGQRLQFFDRGKWVEDQPYPIRELSPLENDYQSPDDEDENDDEF